MGLLWLAAGLLCLFGQGRVLRAQDTESDNPTGPSGDFNGEVTTAGSYDPFTGNLKRRVTDLTVPGSIGAYPLAFARTYNSNIFATGGDLPLFGDGGNWRHNYQWNLSITDFNSSNGSVTGYTVAYPDGSAITFRFKRQSAPASETTFWRGPSGTSDRLEVQSSSALVLHTADGGMVNFGSVGHANSLVDPNGAITLLSYAASNNGYLTQVTEPGGRWLKFSYVTATYNGHNVNGVAFTHTWTLLSQVQASTGQTVTYSEVPTGTDYGSNGGIQTYPYYVLSGVSYDQEALASGANGNVQASYTYNANATPPTLLTATDPHYAGAMVNIRYAGSGTTSIEEQNQGASERVSHLDIAASGGVTTGTETRGDTSSGTGRTAGIGGNLTRTFTFGATNPGNTPSVKPSLLTSASDFEANTSYKYYYGAGDTNGKSFLKSTMDANSNVVGYLHEPLVGKVTQVTLPDMRTRSASWRAADDSGTSLPYYLYSTTDERGQTTTYHHGGPGLVGQINSPDGSVEYYQYQQFVANGGYFYKVSLYQNKLNGVVTYQYDEANHGGSGHAGLLTSVTRRYAVDSGTAVETTQFFYDALDRVTQTTDPRNVTDTYAYNARHQVTKVTHAADSTFAKYGYDDQGNRVSVQDESGYVTTTAYDEYRRPTSVTVPVGPGTSRTTTTTYEHRGSDNRVVGDALSNTSGAFSYQVLPSGKGVQHLYSPNGWLTDAYAGQTQGSGGGLSFSTGLHTQANLTYDPVGHLLQSTDAQGKVWKKSYDTCGRPASATDPLGHVTTTSYYPSTDGARAGLVQSVTTPGQDASNPQATLTTTYTVFDLMGRPTNWTDPNNAFVSGYDAGGNLATQSDGAPTSGSGAHPATQYAYDQLGRKKKVTYADNTFEKWTYDASGNPATYYNRAGAEQVYGQYDQRNRFKGYAWSDNTTGPTNVSYDNASHLTGIANANGALSMTYDDSGALLTETEGLAGGGGSGQTVSYTPDQDGNVKTVTYPGGEVAGWKRDFLGRISEADSSAASVALATYTYTGTWLGSRLTGGGVTTAYGYQDNGRIGVVNQYCGNTDLSYRTYGYYPDGQLSWFKKAAISGGSALENGAGDAYYYQGDGSLVYAFGEAANPGTYSANADTNPTSNLPGAVRVCQYGYDAAGNRTVNNETGTANPATFDAENRYNGLAYNDSRGNVTDMHNGAPVFHYAYDAENRLTSAGPSGGAVTASFAYDALGRLCARTINGVQSRLYYAGSQLVEERNAANAKVHTFYYGAGGERVGLLVANGAALFYHYDARGFVTHLTNYNGAVVEQYLYDAFGTPFVYNAAGTTSYGQTSQVESNRYLWGSDYEWYPEIGLYRCGARFYSPVYARWMQPDPIGQAGGLNIYTYCGNDPVNGIDPSGLTSLNDARPGIVYSYGSNGNTYQGYKDSTGGWVDTTGQGGFINGPGGQELTKVDNAGGDTSNIGTYIMEGFHDAGEAVKGVGDAVEGAVNTVIHPFDTGVGIGNGLVKLYDDPSGTSSAVLNNVVQTFSNPNTAARAFGNVAGQALIIVALAPESPASCFLANTPVLEYGGSPAIGSMGVGERVCTAPDQDQDEATAVDPQTWREVTLRLPNAEVAWDTYEVHALRSPAWLAAAHCAQPGDRVWFELDEQGLRGWAQVERIAPCPPLAAGPGRVVLTTFSHANTDLYRLRVAGQDAPLEVTGRHRLYSATRGAWVAVADLAVGECLQTHAGETTITAKEREPGVFQVYNLEVEGAHRYFVGTAQVLAHNAGCAPMGPLSTGEIADQIAGGHAFGKHVVTEGQYGNLTRSGFADHIQSVMNKPSASRLLLNGRSAYFDQASGTVVVVNPGAADYGTAFIPKNPQDYFYNKLH